MIEEENIFIGKEKFLEDVAIAITSQQQLGNKPNGLNGQEVVDSIIDLIRPILKDYETKNNREWKA
jgi:hypothetical protein|tara:strand:- start:1057 stop:1254 length:198 start_codon:yes stop_codon:yes gene_type:complete